MFLYNVVSTFHLPQTLENSSLRIENFQKKKLPKRKSHFLSDCDDRCVFKAIPKWEVPQEYLENGALS